MKIIKYLSELFVDSMLDKVSKLQKQLLEPVAALNLLLNILQANVEAKLLFCFDKFSIYPFLHFLKFLEYN